MNYIRTLLQYITTLTKHFSPNLTPRCIIPRAIWIRTGNKYVYLPFPTPMGTPSPGRGSCLGAGSGDTDGVCSVNSSSSVNGVSAVDDVRSVNVVCSINSVRRGDSSSCS